MMNKLQGFTLLLQLISLSSDWGVTSNRYAFLIEKVCKKKKNTETGKRGTAGANVDALELSILNFPGPGCSKAGYR